MKVTRPLSFFENMGSGTPQDTLKSSMVFLLTGNDLGAVTFRGHFLRRLIGEKRGLKPTWISNLSQMDVTSHHDFFSPPPEGYFFICDKVSDKDFKQIDGIKDRMAGADCLYYILLIAPNLTTKSKWVEGVSAHPSWALIPSYDFDGAEITTYARLFYGSLWMELSPETQGALPQLINPGTLDQDLEKISLLQAGRGQSPLSVLDLETCLVPGTHKDLDRFLTQTLAQGIPPSVHFLNNLDDDGFGDIALVRILMKELKIVMACHQKNITPATLRGRSFQAGLRLPLLKMPYYERVLGQWPMDRCVRGIAALLSYERHVKSGAAGPQSAFAHCLHQLLMDGDGLFFYRR